MLLFYPDLCFPVLLPAISQKISPFHTFLTLGILSFLLPLLGGPGAKVSTAVSAEAMWASEAALLAVQP